MMKHFSRSLLFGVAWMALSNCGVRLKSEALSGDARSETSSALSGEVFRISGDTPCPSGYAPVSPQEARGNVSAICDQLGGWDIVRLAGGGSIDGPDYGCSIRDHDSRGLGHSLCKKVEQFTISTGDGDCPSSDTVASPLVARAHQGALCNQLGTWYIARLEGGGSMDGPGYGCGIRDRDTRGMGHALCKSL